MVCLPGSRFRPVLARQVHMPRLLFFLLLSVQCETGHTCYAVPDRHGDLVGCKPTPMNHWPATSSPCLFTIRDDSPTPLHPSKKSSVRNLQYDITNHRGSAAAGPRKPYNDLSWDRLSSPCCGGGGALSYEHCNSGLWGKPNDLDRLSLMSIFCFLPYCPGSRAPDRAVGSRPTECVHGDVFISPWSPSQGQGLGAVRAWIGAPNKADYLSTHLGRYYRPD